MQNLNVVLIADVVTNNGPIALGDPSLECVEPDYFEEVKSALAEISCEVTIYPSPEKFIESIERHKEDVVLSLWSGARSRNRKALVASICEAYNIPYVGADAYTQIVCEDKFLAKQFAARFGLRSPHSVLIQSNGDLPLIKALTPPLVAKPNLEGGSIGISAANLVGSHEEASELASRLLAMFCQPIIVEEFVSGDEVSIVVAGHRESITLLDAVGIAIDQPDIDLRECLYSFEIKKQEPVPPIKYSRMTQLLMPEIMESIRLLFRSLDKVELIRVDGRMNGSDFQLIELSPDAHLGSDGAVAAAFGFHSIGYSEMFRHLFSNCLKGRVEEYRNAST